MQFTQQMSIGDQKFVTSRLRRTNSEKNKKSQLMLMRRARAYGSSCAQLISVYLYPFRRTSHFCSQKSHKITKSPLYEVMQDHRRWYH